MTARASRKLTLADIADIRAYERERVGFRQHIIDVKCRRRVSVGPHITFVFENRDTVRFQPGETISKPWSFLTPVLYYVYGKVRYEQSEAALDQCFDAAQTFVRVN